MIADVTNLFVVFFPDSGGNHLANLLSQSFQYEARCAPADYHSAQLDAHYSLVMNNVSHELLQQELSRRLNQSNVFCGHWTEILELKKHNLLQHLPNRKYVVIQVPDEPGRGYDAIFRSRLGPVLNEHSWAQHDIRSLYTPSNIMLTLQESPEVPCYGISANTLYADDIKLTLNTLQNDGLDIIVDIEEVQSMHSKWLNNIKERYQP